MKDLNIQRLPKNYQSRKTVEANMGRALKGIQKRINRTMKEMNNIEKFTDKEWEELASILSDEKS